MTLEFARDWCEWKKLIKKLYPEKFFWHDEAMWVRTPDGEIGQIVEYTYFPTSDTFYIAVKIKARVISFGDPHELEVVKEPEKQTWSYVAL